VRGVFRVGRGPDDFVYDYDADTITPTLPDGDSFAVVLYRAARYLAGGMDGAIMYRTRALAVTDRGNKKRDLLRELEIEIHKIEGGECVWAAKQAFDTFFHALRDGSISDAMTDVDVSGARTVSINVP